MENVQTISCKCVSVVRGNYDFSRGCFRYTCVMQPEAAGDDVFADSDLFESDYRIPVRDTALRTPEQPLSAKAVCTGDALHPVMPADDILTAWDAVVASRFVGKSTKVDTTTVSVKDLSDGKLSSYIVEIGSEKNEVASRNISALHGRLDKAIARVKNQIAKYISKQEEEAGQ